MQIINFTVKEILPALLDKSKTQTIRKGYINFSEEKPPRFKVGEQVQIMWKQRSVYNTFTILDGEQSLGFGEEGKDFFRKKLGTARITEVFKIYMFYPDPKDISHGVIQIFDDDGLVDIDDEDAFEDEIVKRDGFVNSHPFYRFFSKYFKGQQETLPFWVYRWEWIE